MATQFQVTFDSADPGAHAAFWAEALHYVRQPPPSGFDSWDAALDAWGVPADHRNDSAALVDPGAAGGRRRVRCHHPAQGGKCGGRARAQVAPLDAMTGRQQVAGHGQPHVP